MGATPSPVPVPHNYTMDQVFKDDVWVMWKECVDNVVDSFAVLAGLTESTTDEAVLTALTTIALDESYIQPGYLYDILGRPDVNRRVMALCSAILNEWSADKSKVPLGLYLIFERSAFEDDVVDWKAFMGLMNELSSMDDFTEIKKLRDLLRSIKRPGIVKAGYLHGVMQKFSGVRRTLLLCYVRLLKDGSQHQAQKWSKPDVLPPPSFAASNAMVIPGSSDDRSTKFNLL